MADRHCLHCHAVIPSRFGKGQTYCHAQCREQAKLARQRRRQLLDEFADVCRLQRRRVERTVLASLRRSAQLHENTPSPLEQDHHVITKGRC